MESQIEKAKSNFLDVSDKLDLAEFLKSSLKILDGAYDDFEKNLCIDSVFVYQLDDDLLASYNDGSAVTPIYDKKVGSEMMLFALKKRIRLSMQNPKRTYRLPGVVSVDGDSIKRLENILSIKSLIKDAMTDGRFLKPRQRGAFFTRNVEKECVLLELYRSFTVLSNPVKSLSFVWGKRVPQSQHFLRNELIKNLKDSLDDIEDVTAPFAMTLTEEIRRLSELPENVKLKTRRMIPPHVRCNIVMDNEVVVGGALMDSFQRHSHLPIFLDSTCNQSGTFEVNALPDMVDFKRKARPNLTSGFELFLPRLNLYKGR